MAAITKSTANAVRAMKPFVRSEIMDSPKLPAQRRVFDISSLGCRPRLYQRLKLFRRKKRYLAQVVRLQCCIFYASHSNF